MATTIYFRRGAGNDLDASTAFNNGVRYSPLDTALNLTSILNSATTSRGSALATGTGNTANGPVNGLEVVISGSSYVWVTPPLSANVTVSGTVTLNVWAAESNMSANVAANVRLLRVQPDGTVTEFLKSTRTTEMAVTTRAVNNFTATPTSTNFVRGDRICMVYFGDDAGTMATGFTHTFGWGATSGSVDGDSFVTLTENLTFESTPSGSQVFLTNNTLLSSTQKEAWTSRGGGVQSTVTNTATGPTSPIQVTASAGGSAVEWYTRQLQATTLNGACLVNVRAAASNTTTNVQIRCEIAVCDADGSNVTVWGANAHYTNLTTSEVAYQFWVSGASQAIAANQRLRIRLYLDDLAWSGTGGGSPNMVGSRTATAWYAGTSGGASGDCYVTFPITLTEGGSTVTGSFTANAIRLATITPAGGATAEEKDLFQTSPTNNDFFGDKPVISGNGQVMAACARGQTITYIANYPFTSWTAVTSPTASPSSIALSYDGSVLVLGDSAYATPVSQNGRAYVYSGSNWGTQTVLNRTNSAGANMGSVCCVSDDNATIVLGGSGGGTAGKIYIFSGSNWSTIQVLTPANAGGISTVHISTDKSTIVAGDGNYNGAGSVRGRVLIWNGSSYGTETQKTQSSPVNSDRMGTITAVTRDCSTIVAGYSFATNGGTNRGKAWIWSGASWGTETALSPSDLADSMNFSCSLDISNDGTHVIVGAFNAANGGSTRGKAYVYNGASWGTETGISSVSPVNAAQFGSLVKISDNGSVLWIAAVADGTNSAGSISVCSGSGWSTVTRRMPSDASASNNFADVTNNTNTMPISRSPTAANYVVAAGARTRANGGTNRGELYWFSNVTTGAGITADAYFAAGLPGGSGTFTGNAIIKKTISGAAQTFTANAALYNAWDWVAPPADTVSMSATPTLTLISPNPGIYPGWFQIQLDTSSAFNTGNLRTYRMGDGVGTWEYHNGSTWVAMPATGMSSSFKGNQVRFTVPDALSAGTWYRRWRWQIHT